MIPIHYFLLLFAALISLSGCTQRMPPGVANPDTKTSGNTTGLAGSSTSGPTDEQKTPPSSDSSTENSKLPNTLAPVVKPLPNTSSLVIEQGEKGELNFTVTGPEAKNLYSLMETEVVSKDKETSVKTGASLTCTETASSHECHLALDLSTGAMKSLVKDEELKLDAANASLALKELAVSAYFELDPISVGKYGRMNLYGDYAKTVYDALKVDATNLQPTDAIPVSAGKLGKEMKCYQEQAKGSKDFTYRCIAYFGYDSGKFDKVESL